MADLINEVETVANDVSNTVNKTSGTIKTIGVIILITGLIFGFAKGLFHMPSLPPTQVIVNKVASVTVKANSVSYIPEATKANPKPTPVSIYKPIESNPTITNGQLTIPYLGTTFEPFAYCSLTKDYGFRPYLAIRLIYWNQFGIQVGANDVAAFLGLDLRLPILSNIAIAVGGSIGYTNPSIDPYIGLGIQLSN